MTAWFETDASPPPSGWLPAPAIHPDEPALWITELVTKVAVPNQGEQWTRVQSIGVIRNGLPAEWRKVLGHWTEFHGRPEFRVPLAEAHTVGEAMDIAEALREPKHERMEEVSEDWEDRAADEWGEQLDQSARLVRNRSTYGRQGFIQRNGWSHYAAKERGLA